MTHFGILCPAATGHLNPMCALGRELQRRGHQVTLFGIPDIQPKVMNSELDFWMLGEAEFPAGTLEQAYKQLGEMSGLVGVKFTVRRLQQETVMLFREVPEALKVAGVEALLVDHVMPGAGTIADLLNLPFITVCNALLIDREPAVPPYFTGWSYSKAWWARLRNQMGKFFLDRVGQPIWDVVVQQRQQWKLPPYDRREDADSQLAQICQLPAEYDFPRVNLPQCFHYTGPFRKSSLQSVPFPFEQLSDQPLIYASMGTLQNRKQEIFQCIAAACKGLDAQLVLSLGGGSRVEEFQGLPGAPLVVEYAPQLELLTKARLTITHAGLNTVLESLSNGVPMVAIPITNDQPGVGARVSWTGTGEVVPLSRLSVSRLRAAIRRVLTEDSYSSAASRLKEAIHQSGGVERAADIVEQAVSTKAPVLRA
jgi:UDP:flavonoid glycosyltransferase YjiC (YdhE family)